MKIQKVALIGLGSMGAFFAPKLAGYPGIRFCVIAQGARRERLERKGVIINGANYRFPVEEPGQAGPADLVIMAVKDTALDGAIQDIRSQVGESTQILCVMNGVDSENRVAAAYGWEHVLYSYMRISIAMKDGVADFDPEAGSVHFGERLNETISPRVRAIQELFDACGIRWHTDRDMLRGLWFKFMCNIGENMTCALLGVPFGAFRTSAHASEIRRAAMHEVAQIANKRGIGLSEADMERQEKRLFSLPFWNKPSTLQDLEQGRSTEIAMFAGRVVEMGRESGVATPVNWMFYHGIRVLEEKNAGLIAPPSKTDAGSDLPA